jgi:hypothetical protein
MQAGGDVESSRPKKLKSFSSKNLIPPITDNGTETHQTTHTRRTAHGTPRDAGHRPDPTPKVTQNTKTYTNIPD